MGKTISQKNSEQLLLQQQSELAELKESVAIETVRAAEDKLLAQCLSIIEDSLDYAALGFTKTGEVDVEAIPFAWSQLTPDEKARKIRLARYACLPSSDVPYGTKAAFATATAIIKSRATEKSGTKVFNMEVSYFPPPAPLEKPKDSIDADFEVIDLE